MLVVTSVGFAACSTKAGPDAAPSLGSAVIGAKGGTVESSDHALTVTIPAGAMSQDTTITISVATGVPAGAIGNAYDIEPTGTQFASPVALKFAVPGGTDAFAVQVGTQVGSAWQSLGLPIVGDSVVGGLTTHLSTYALYDAIQCTGVGSASTCPAPEQCVNGGCGIPCSTQSDCPLPLYCRYDSAAAVSTCVSVTCTNHTCPTLAGVACDSLDICSATCSGAGGCPVGQACGNDGTCGYDVCSEGTCPPGTLCVPSSLGGVCIASSAGCECGQGSCDCTGNGSGGSDGSGTPVDAGVHLDSGGGGGTGW